MNFNVGEVLSRAGQITWRYKNLWLAGIAVSLVGLIPALISLGANPAFSSFSDPAEVNRELPRIMLANGFMFLFSILSIPIYVIGITVPSLGTLQIEKGNETFRFGELLKGSLPYFWRILGIFLIVWVGVFLVLGVVMACILGVSVLTLGIGALCAFPIFILFIPIAILVYAIMEQGVSAVIVDNLGMTAALQRAWELVKKNFGVMALMSVIIYLGATLISMVISLPMLVPMYSFMFNMGSEPDMQTLESLSRNMTLWMLAIAPLLALFQGLMLTFMQAAWTLTYMRLTAPQANIPVMLEAGA
ncbi:MAG TPA: hypothetical protein VK897_15715 [Anaerolineales bacterium]|nr:hypothetical protein [Anaerolineales bacterium]